MDNLSGVFVATCNQSIKLELLKLTCEITSMLINNNKGNALESLIYSSKN